jgi:Transcriptional regulator, AbiEi antitoxin/Protein of unknown function (DUF559)
MASARREGDGIRPKLVESSVDERIAALATRQHGVVATRQLVALGLTRRAVSHRAQAGRLHPLHRGVYAVGHADISYRGRWMAAVLAHGDGAVLSHRSAAALWEVLADTAQRTEVTVPTAGGRAVRDRVRVHRSPTLRPDEVTIRKRIPVTTPARTVLDLAAALAPRQLERLLDQVEVERLTDARALGAIAIAHPRHHGSHRLRVMLATHLAGTTLTRSDLESRFLGLCRAYGLPTPQVNVRLGENTVDFLFPDRRLIVEIDSWKYHRTRARFGADRRRDATHLAAGYRTLRFTDRQLDNEPNAVAQTTRSALHRRDAA